MPIPQKLIGFFSLGVPIKVNTLVCTGLGSLSGKMSPHVVARQMRVAYEKVLLNKYDYSHWREEKQMERYMKCEIPFPPEDLEKPLTYDLE